MGKMGEMGGMGKRGGRSCAIGHWHSTIPRNTGIGTAVAYCVREGSGTLRLREGSL